MPKKLKYNNFQLFVLLRVGQCRRQGKIIVLILAQLLRKISSVIDP